jgi:hypothetical protein
MTHAIRDMSARLHRYTDGDWDDPGLIPDGAISTRRWENVGTGELSAYWKRLAVNGNRTGCYAVIQQRPWLYACPAVGGDALHDPTRLWRAPTLFARDCGAAASSAAVKRIWTAGLQLGLEKF